MTHVQGSKGPDSDPGQKKKKSAANWLVYLLRCSDNSLYCGVTNNLENRLLQHNQGTGARYTRSRRPVALAAVKKKLTKIQAFQLEYRIKRLPAQKKVPALTTEDPD